MYSITLTAHEHRVAYIQVVLGNSMTEVKPTFVFLGVIHNELGVSRMLEHGQGFIKSSAFKVVIYLAAKGVQVRTFQKVTCKVARTITRS